MAQRTQDTHFGFPAKQHNHKVCIQDSLARGEAVCKARGARLTDLRREVLALVWQGHAPIGAYDILESLRATRPGAQPPTVYRALDFLIEQGLIHRIERLNAYVGCVCPESEHAGQFLLCSECGLAAELTDRSVEKALSTSAAKAGFAIAHPTVEIEGVCPACAPKTQKPQP